MPVDIEKKFPVQWKNDDEEGGRTCLKKSFQGTAENTKSGSEIPYTKITNNNDGQKLVDNIHNMLANDINIIVYNFVDMLSHARTEMEVLKELP